MKYDFLSIFWFHCMIKWQIGHEISIIHINSVDSTITNKKSSRKFFVSYMTTIEGSSEGQQFESVATTKYFFAKYSFKEVLPFDWLFFGILCVWVQSIDQFIDWFDNYKKLFKENITISDQ